MQLVAELRHKSSHCLQVPNCLKCSLQIQKCCFCRWQERFYWAIYKRVQQSIWRDFSSGLFPSYLSEMAPNNVSWCLIGRPRISLMAPELVELIFKAALIFFESASKVHFEPVGWLEVVGSTGSVFARPLATALVLLDWRTGGELFVFFMLSVIALKLLISSSWLSSCRTNLKKSFCSLGYVSFNY